MKSKLYNCLVLISISFILIGCTLSSNRKNDKSDIAIEIGDQQIKKQEFNKVLDNKIKALKSKYDTVPKKKRKKLMKFLRFKTKRDLVRKIETRLLLQYYINQENITVPDDMINKRIERIKSNYPSKDAFKQALEHQGKTNSEFKQEIKNQIATKRFINNKINEQTVTDSEARLYYNSNKSEFTNPRKIKIRYFEAKKGESGKQKTQDIRKRAKNGQSFGKLIRKHSRHPTASNGGMLGFVARKDLSDSIPEDVFQNLNPGTISPLIETGRGWVLLKSEEVKEQYNPDYETISDTVRRTVKKQKRREKVINLLQKLREKAPVINNVADTDSSVFKKN